MLNALKALLVFVLGFADLFFFCLGSLVLGIYQVFISYPYQHGAVVFERIRNNRGKR